jgi:hypothetical protein
MFAKKWPEGHRESEYSSLYQEGAYASRRSIKQPAQEMPLSFPKFSYLMIETFRSISVRHLQASFNIYGKINSKRRGSKTQSLVREF